MVFSWQACTTAATGSVAFRQAVGSPSLTATPINASRASRKSRMRPITSSVFWCTTQWSAPAISRTVRSSQ